MEARCLIGLKRIVPRQYDVSFLIRRQRQRPLDIGSQRLANLAFRRIVDLEVIVDTVVKDQRILFMLVTSSSLYEVIFMITYRL
jgi:hypothetical protein